MIWEAEDSSVTTLTITLLDWATAYLRHAEKNFVYKTFSEKRLAFERFSVQRSLLPCLSCTVLPLATILEALQIQAEVRSGNAANKDRKNLAAAWAWGVKYLGLPTNNPFAQMERFASVRSPRYVPPLEDFWRVYEKAGSERDQFMLYCYLQTGARRDELFRLRWSDVDFDRRRIRLSWRKNKTGTWHDQWLPVKEDLAEWLRRFAGSSPLDGFVFVGPDLLPYKFRQH